MLIRIVRKALLVLTLFVVAYLLIVAVWSWASFNDAVSGAPAVVGAPLSKRQTDILLRVEDPDFFEHTGLSLAKGQGLATISSAVARDVFLFEGKLDGIKGKFQALYRGVFNCCKRIDVGRDMMALVLDANLSKERQLALYVSNVYMGTQQGLQIRGLARAADSYLGKPLDRTTDEEFIGLVTMIKAPNQYHPVMHPAAHAVRAARISALMAGRCQPGGWFDTSFDQCDR